jgi:hypothetical protein
VAFNRSASNKGSPAAGVATAEPPLYYALESVPYLLAGSGTLLDRLQLMRLTTALLACFTALFTYLFLREALARAPWAPVRDVRLDLDDGFWTAAASCLTLIRP